MIVVLASFSAIGCKNNNTNPGDTITGTDIGEKHPGDFYLNATIKLEFSPSTPTDGQTLINMLEPNLPKDIKNVLYTINPDGSITTTSGNDKNTIAKDAIKKEGDNKYIITTVTSGEISSVMPEEKEEFTFNADGTATSTSYVIFKSKDGNTYNLYFYKDGQLTKEPVQ
ncbi:hypothetical protein [Brachyspira intermedia]|uniref:hypothetical protein n=1 Tax=Brachyspira intermedia TaxID=84377 RepID=UPI00300674DD